MQNINLMAYLTDMLKVILQILYLKVITFTICELLNSIYSGMFYVKYGV
jgi:hypothetical protein